MVTLRGFSSSQFFFLLAWNTAKRESNSISLATDERAWNWYFHAVTILKFQFTFLLEGDNRCILRLLQRITLIYCNFYSEMDWEIVVTCQYKLIASWNCIKIFPQSRWNKQSKHLFWIIKMIKEPNEEATKKIRSDIEIHQNQSLVTLVEW